MGRDARLGARQAACPLATVAELLGPVLWLKAQNKRRLSARFGGGLAACFGRGHNAAKLFAAAVVLGLTPAATIQGEYRVTAPAVLEGSEQRALVAPVEGFIASSSVRAGDVVQAGELLASLDTRELELERERLASQLAQHRKQLREAMPGRDRAEVIILSAQIRQTGAQLALIDDRLARTKLHAPFGGVIISGDLSQRLGSPVERGEVLFENAPLDGYRVALEVAEEDIAAIEQDQIGRLVLASAPGAIRELTATRLTPVATVKEGRNYFRVEAQLDGDARAGLRPGMRGVAKVGVGQQSLLWIWPHRLIDRPRLLWWTLWPQ